ncbi:MAG: hypothetical protein ABIJ09_02920 [Pseudomonadota bacterium]
MSPARSASVLALVAVTGCWRGGFDTWRAPHPGHPDAASAADRRLAEGGVGADGATAEDAAADAAPVDSHAVEAGIADAAAADADTADAPDASVPPFVPTLVGGAEIGASVNQIVVAGPLAVLATAAAGSQLRVLDVASPASPQPLGSAAASDTALHGVVVAGATAYAVGEGTPPLLETFDLSDPSQPRRLGSAALADTGYDIAVSAGRAYVVSAAGGDDLEIFDVADPANPTRLGGLNVLDSYYVRGVDVVGAVAYIGGSVLKSIDVADPATPVELDSTTWSEGFYWYSYDVQAVGDLVYAIESNNNGGPQLRIFDASDPTNLVRIGAVFATNSYVRDLEVEGSYAFVAADDSNDFVDVFDVRDPAAPQKVLSTVLPTGGLTVAVEGGVMLVGQVQNSGDELELYELRAP